jgi:hypothetical protein
MHARQTGVLLAMLWLAGCAAPCSVPQTKTQAQVQEQVREQVQEQEEQEAQEESQAAELQEHEWGLTVPKMLSGMEQVAGLKPKAAKMLIQRLQAKTDELSAGDRFELALLLSQKGDDKSLKQAWQLVNRLTADAQAPGVLEILRLQQRNLDLEQRYRMERRKSAELKKKIEHIKGLERELDESNKRMEEPLNPTPGPTR